MLWITYLFIVYSLVITGLYFRAVDQINAGTTGMLDANQAERDQWAAHTARLMADLEHAEREAAYWEAVARNHPSARGPELARMVLASVDDTPPHGTRRPAQRSGE